MNIENPKVISEPYGVRITNESYQERVRIRDDEPAEYRWQTSSQGIKNPEA
ncbi:hypothetical protein [Aureibacter tunicatorum]|uniref:Uncharacterized protein n=1 Tax=Aureibacter tunicatorum TaxID=866807 RepID=A0AAE3XU32_9BACT|nr:hypothetical protein [Aureibacter tunicatorum]MDR6242108.1 hypothetical protein [Aureibacter tunicatorum]BDD07533.1 hypothetical protein AUTU_50160 [Aureibacter tunicatorum]